MTAQLHPRQLQADRYWIRRREDQLNARNLNVLTSYFAAGDRVDAFTYLEGVNGTLPEKLLLQEILEKRVSVYFSAYVGDFPFTPDKEERARPDFILPDYHIVIEVYGTYWHSREGSWERDAYRTAMYMAMGFDVRIIVDTDIITNPRFALETAVPELVHVDKPGDKVWIPYRFNPGAAIAARLKRWPSKRPTKQRTKRLGVLTPQTHRGAPRKRTEYGPMFTGFPDSMQDYVQSIREYSVAYRNWVEGDLAVWAEVMTTFRGGIIDYIWIGDMDHVGETDWVDENGVKHTGYGYWRPVYWQLSREDKELLAFYYRWRTWWKRWSLS